MKKNNSPLLSSPAWPTFLSQFGPQFDEVCRIIEQLHTQPEQLEKMELSLLPVEELVQSQQNWVRLCSQLDNPIENTFFKPWWVLIEKDSLGIFIDLSDPGYGIFATQYFFTEPYQWYKRYIVQDINQVLHASETGYDVRKEMAVHYKAMWKVIEERGTINSRRENSGKERKTQSNGPIDRGSNVDEDGNLLNPGPEDIYTPLPDEFMPDWYQERMERINARNSEFGGFEISNE